MKRLSFLLILINIIILFSSPSVFAQTPPFKVAWKTGIIMGLIVPPTTTKKQLTDLIYTFRQAKKEKTLSALIPPINLGLQDKYTAFTIFIFSDPKWATSEKYKYYENASIKTAKGRTISKAYINHIIASYEYDVDGKEYGALGYDEGSDKSVHYKKLF